MNIKQFDFFYDLRRLPFVEAIWLYGSRARTNNRDRSDIDLALICTSATPEDWNKVVEIVENADTAHHIDVVRFDILSKNHLIRQNIIDDKVVLFERIQNAYPWYESFLDLKEALDQLLEMVEEPELKETYVKDATIKRFEFCYEIFWKTLKKICIYEDYEVTSPKSVLEQSFEIKLIDDVALWSMMHQDRNITSHTYKRKEASQIYYRVKNYYSCMHETFLKIKEKYKV